MPDSHELSVTRLIKASPETVWRIYTERTRDWFCPRPWTTPEVDFDLRPGGRADVTMQSPEGERHSYRGVFLEVVPNRKLVSTSALTEGWVPQPGEMNFVRIDTFEPEDGGTLYTARARHWDAKAADAHRDMGFEQGWGTVADQLAELAEAAQ
ncbi:SRPBCC family protein [uncultured Brevundimonas sp.]|uniref:SRPBCC family protein n=1 Tax=uncultured Brevundimonas sp. TaxID=213418 RepID=UPI0030EF44E3|tara:strand:+ start:1219 stop:1677 length:459 start_codon:yes stop_codon:yes gene_type:complete